MVPLKIKLPEHFLEEETRSGYSVKSKMKEVWAVELDLLAELQRVFEKYGIPYFAYAGPTLGAVRHNGFIPWDDDIDLFISRSSFHKLCKIAKKEFKPPYFFQTEETDYGCVTGLAKFRNSNTTMILNSHKSRNFAFNQGIFLDIFVYDNIPDDENERSDFFRKVSILKEKSLRFRNTFHCDINELNTIKGKIKHFLEFLIKILHIKNPYYKKLSKLCQEYNSSKTQYVADIFSFTNVLVTKADWYKDCILMPFEFLKLPVPKDFDSYLQEHFGDWKIPKMVPPDHGFETVCDTNKPYTKYLADFKKERFN